MGFGYQRPACQLLQTPPVTTDNYRAKCSEILKYIIDTRKRSIYGLVDIDSYKLLITHIHMITESESDDPKFITDCHD